VGIGIGDVKYEKRFEIHPAYLDVFGFARKLFLLPKFTMYGNTGPEDLVALRGPESEGIAKTQLES
jgi:hypothetical protein